MNILNLLTAKFAKDLRKERKELNFSHFLFANVAVSLRLCGKKTLFKTYLTNKNKDEKIYR